MNTTFFEKSRETLARSAEAQRLYLGNGGPRPGKIVTYKELASTFRQVAEGGAEVFYRGPSPRPSPRAVREAGGWLDEADLAAFTPEWRQPVTITYRGHEVSSVPPPFSAFQMLETLNIMEGFDVAGWGHNSPELPAPPHRGHQDRLGGPPRLRLPQRRVQDPRSAGSCPRPTRPRSGRASTPARAGVSEGERHTPDEADGPDLRGASRRLHARPDHALRVRGRRGHGGLGDPDAGRPVRLGLRGAGHRPRAEQYPQVDGPAIPRRRTWSGRARRPAP